jgi:ABC-type branched-subunit amino acid transport system substrate-binding protein
MDIRVPRARTTAAALAAVLLGLPAALAGCGNSSSATIGATACATQAPGVTATSVKLGLIYPSSGPAGVASAFESARGTAQARIDQQNAQGGVNGRRIDLVWADDQSQPQVFRHAAENLVDTQQAFGLLALSIAMEDSAPWLQQQGIPVVGVATSKQWSQYPNVFHFGNLYNQGAASTFGDFVRAQGGTRALIVSDPTVAASQTLAGAFAPSLISRGIKVVGEVTYVPGVTDPARVAAQVKSSGADVLLGAAQTDPFIDIFAWAKADGARLAVALNATGYSNSLLLTRGQDMAGMSVISGYAALDSPAMLAYDHAMATYAPELTDPSSELALAGDVSASEMIKGLEVAGPCPTRASFIANLRKVTDFSAGGLIAPVNLANPTAPDACFNFVRVDPTGSSFAAVPPPTVLNKDNYWCGTPLA